MQVHVAKADITNLPVDAIVLPAVCDGAMTAGVALAIATHGGEIIVNEALDAAPIAVGAALITSGGELPAKHVIHVPIAEREGLPSSAEDVRRAARAALLAASARKLAVIAIPGMGTNSGVPVEDQARAIVEEIRAHKKEFPTTIYLVDLNDMVVEEFEYAMGAEG